MLTAFLSKDQIKHPFKDPFKIKADPFMITGNYFVFSLEWSSISLILRLCQQVLKGRSIFLLRGIKKRCNVASV